MQTPRERRGGLTNPTQPPTTPVNVTVTVLNTLPSETPSEVSTPIAVAEISSECKPYSMAVAPDWSLMILLSFSRHTTSSCYVGGDIQTPRTNLTNSKIKFNVFL